MYAMRCHPFATIFQRVIFLKSAKSSGSTHRHLKRYFSGGSNNINRETRKPDRPSEIQYQQMKPPQNAMQIGRRDYVHVLPSPTSPGSNGLVKFPLANNIMNSDSMIGGNKETGILTIIVNKSDVCTNPNENVTIRVGTEPKMSPKGLIDKLSDAEVAEICSARLCAKCSRCPKCEEGRLLTDPESRNPKRKSDGSQLILPPRNVSYRPRNTLQGQMASSPIPMVNDRFVYVKSDRTKNRNAENFSNMRKIIRSNHFVQRQVTPKMEQKPNNPVQRQRYFSIHKSDETSESTRQKHRSLIHRQPSQNRFISPVNFVQQEKAARMARLKPMSVERSKQTLRSVNANSQYRTSPPSNLFPQTRTSAMLPNIHNGSRNRLNSPVKFLKQARMPGTVHMSRARLGGFGGLPQNKSKTNLVSLQNIGRNKNRSAEGKPALRSAGRSFSASLKKPKNRVNRVRRAASLNVVNNNIGRSVSVLNRMGRTPISLGNQKNRQSYLKVSPTLSYVGSVPSVGKGSSLSNQRRFQSRNRFPANIRGQHRMRKMNFPPNKNPATTIYRRRLSPIPPSQFRNMSKRNTNLRLVHKQLPKIMISKQKIPTPPLHRLRTSWNPSLQVKNIHQQKVALLQRPSPKRLHMNMQPRQIMQRVESRKRNKEIQPSLPPAMNIKGDNKGGLQRLNDNGSNVPGNKLLMTPPNPTMPQPTRRMDQPTYLPPYSQENNLKNIEADNQSKTSPSANTAVLFYAPGKMKLINAPLPRISGDQGVIIKMLYVHLTDVDAQMFATGKDGLLKLTEPTLAGRTGSGIIVDVGQQVKNVKIGDKVTIKSVSCGKCAPCKSNNLALCERVPVVEKFGSLTRYLAYPADFVAKLPDNVNPIDGAMMDELSSAISACKKSGITAGDNAMILDGGSLGLCTALTAKSLGATNVCLADSRKPILDQARKLGIDCLFLIDRNSPVSNISIKMSEYMGGDKPRIVFDCNGSQLTNQIAIQAAKFGGKVVLMNNDGSNHSVVISDAIHRDIDILSSHYGNDESEDAALQFLSTGRVQFSGVNSQFFDLSKVHEAFQLLASKRATSNIFVKCNQLDDENGTKKKDSS